ncbi:hypothetical protein [Pontimicrobium sp. MEBiC01747]|jgi:hypothetical protein
MNFIKKLGAGSIFMLLLCLVIIIVAEYLFLTGDQLHGIFLGLWVPTLLGIMIFFKLVENGRK